MNSADQICAIIKESAKTSLDTGDFISYSTILDLNIGDPSRFSEDEALCILWCLLETLQSNDTLIYRAGWDIPEILIRYLQHFNMNEEHVLVGDSVLKVVMKILTTLCERGNPRELFLKSCELMVGLESDYPTVFSEEHLNREDGLLKEAELKDDQEPIAEGMAVYCEENNGAKPFSNKMADSRHENVKFCLLFEIMSYSLQRIPTHFPSRFLSIAAGSMLTVASTHSDILSVSTCLRRMFLLARDFSMDIQEGTRPEELAQTRKYLVNFLTHAVDESFRRFGVKWAQRLYYQMVNRKALAPIEDRELSYRASEYTKRMTDVVERISQLALAYDFDIEGELHKRIDSESLDIRTPLSPPAENVGGTPEESPRETPLGTPLSSADEYTRSSSPDDIMVRLEEPSPSGMVMMYTQLHFDGSRRKAANLPRFIACHLRIMPSPSTHAGLRDALMYWVLWISGFVTEEAVAECDPEQMRLFLISVQMLAATTSSKIERHFLFSAIAKLIRSMDKQRSFEFLMDTLEECPYCSVKVSAVQMLKMLVIGKTRCDEQSLGRRETCLGCMLQLTSEQQLRVALLAECSIGQLLQMYNHITPLLLSWLNLLTVVPLDEAVVNRICEKLETYGGDVLSPAALSIRNARLA